MRCGAQHPGVQPPQFVVLLGAGQLGRERVAQGFQGESSAGAASSAARTRSVASLSMTTKASSRVSK